MSTEKVNEILRQAEDLSSKEKVTLAQQLLAQAQSESSNRDQIHQNRTRWLRDHRSEYAGQWVAFDEDQLICHGTNNREVLAEVRQRGVKVPFVTYIEPLDALPFGGW